MKNKAPELARLKGILSGISTDKSINEKELLFLDAWLRDRQDSWGDNGDAVDLIEQIADVLEDGVITQEEMEDTLNLIECILEYQENPPLTDNQQEVFGFIQGVVSDGHVDSVELEHICKMLRPLHEIPIFALLSKRIERQRNDHTALLDTLKSCSGFYFNETGTTQEWSCFLSDKIPENFDFINARICFTGGISGLPRSSLKRHVEKIGSVYSKSLSSHVDMLVVGDECSAGWLEYSYGTKLDAACRLKLKGHNVLIVTSDEWLSKVSNISNPKSEQKQKAWVGFGDARTFTGLFEALEKVCEDVPLTVSQYNDEHQGLQGVAIHRQWKNGKPLKKMELFLEHMPYHYNELSNEMAERIRAWIVGGSGLPTVTFKSQDNAFERFRELLANLVAFHSKDS